MKSNSFIGGFLRSSMMFAVAIASGSLWAQGSFVYTNNNPAGSNTVSALSVGTNGVLTPIAGSPFPTGGTGDGGGFFATNRVVASGKLLFASNAASADVSVFTIDPTSGALTSVAGSPFKTGATSGGIALAATPDGKFLMAANSSTKTVSVFSVATNGVLTLASQCPTATTPDAAKVSPDGKFLAVAEPFIIAVEMFSIAADGSLTSLGTFAGSGISGTEMADVDINCANNTLYASEYNVTDTIVDAYSIGAGGMLTAISGSPFTAAGLDSAAVLLSPDDKTVFVSNPPFGTLAVASVAADGSLSFLARSPFAMISPLAPAGMATSADGNFLYVANFRNVVSVFSVAANGIPTEVAGSPFSTGVAGFGLHSLAAFPPKVCAGGININPQPAQPPVTTAVATPGPNAYGWNNTNVTVTLAAIDTGGPGVKAINFSLSGAQTGIGSIAGASGTIPITTEGVTTLTYFAQDTAGNKEKPKTLSVQIDKTPPTLTAALSPLPNVNSWNNTNVTVQFTATDALSGVASVSSPVTMTTEGSGQAVTGNAADHAGNTAFLTVTVNIDKTPPVISGMPAPDCTLWPPNHKLVQVANVSATDALSGVAPGTFEVTGTSNEAVNATGSGHTAPDVVINGGSIELRAERSGSGTGRVYTIQATAANLAGNVAKASGVCVVPHDSGGAQ